jgi:hypothetical protein
VTGLFNFQNGPIARKTAKASGGTRNENPVGQRRDFYA